MFMHGFEDKGQFKDGCGMQVSVKDQKCCVLYDVSHSTRISTKRAKGTYQHVSANVAKLLTQGP